MSAKRTPMDVANSLHHFHVALSLFKFEGREMTIQIGTSSNIIMMIDELIDFVGK